ncbi:putative Chitin synthase [Seiridium unicorne]|uniref:Chitin synthase n=1 Tax=Seiridium unicorne TaxID=138068 RepID=A0ABR2UKA9_9PEZI
MNPNYSTKRLVDYNLDTNGSSNYVYLSKYYSDAGIAYAFSSVHDGSWGHKSGKKVYVAIPINLGSKPDTAEPVDNSQEDIDAQSEATVKRALTPFELDKSSVEEDKEDAFMKFRTVLVAVYLFSNSCLCVTIMNELLSFFGDSYMHKIWFFKIWMWNNSELPLLQ